MQVRRSQLVWMLGMFGWLGFFGWLGLSSLFAGCGTARFAVVTQHNDGYRTGAYLSESALTPASVNHSGMALRTWRPVDGNLNAQLLYAPRVSVAGATKNIVLAFTSNNTAYAYDLDDETAPGTNHGLIWQQTLPLSPRPGFTTSMGIYSTPVIDLAESTIYLVYGLNNGMPPWNGEGDVGYEAEFHLAALDLRTGVPLRDTIISGWVPSTVPPGRVDFLPRRQIQRAALLMTPNPVESGQRTIYIPFGSRWREETHNWHGWVFGYDAATFAPRGVFCSTPDRRANSEGGGIWQGGAGVAADDSGALFFNTGNGPGAGADHGNSIVKLTPVRSTAGVYDLTVTAFGAAADDPSHAVQWRDNDIDLAGGGVTVIPDSGHVAGGGKTGVMYLMDRSTMTKVQSFEAFTNTYNPSLRYDDWMSGPHMHGAPTYWVQSATLGYVYHWGEKDRLKRFAYNRSTGRLDSATPVVGDVVAESDLMPGGLISLSANGTRDGLLWITLPAHSGGRLFAYDALTMRRLWDTTQPGGVSHSNPPTIAEGRVLVGATNGEFLVYGLNQFRIPLPPKVYRKPPYPPIGPDPMPRVRQWMRSVRPESAAKLAVPRGQRAAFLASASGSMAYVAQASPAEANRFEWVLEQTSIDLLDQSGIMPNMGRNGLGHPIATWDGMGILAEAHGGKVLLLTSKAIVDAPKAGDLPWGLFQLEGKSENLLGSITFVQRLETKGGVPSAAPKQPGERVKVPFEAAFAFYCPESAP